MVERMVAKGVMVWGGVVGAQPKKSPISDVAYNYDTYRSESMRSVVDAWSCFRPWSRSRCMAKYGLLETLKEKRGMRPDTAFRCDFLGRVAAMYLLEGLRAVTVA